MFNFEEESYRPSVEERVCSFAWRSGHVQANEQGAVAYAAAIPQPRRVSSSFIDWPVS